MQLLKEFMDFLNEYKIIGLAIAFIIGAAATDLVQSLVKNIIMPIIQPLLSNGDWQNITLTIGQVNIGLGQFLASLINFLIIAIVVFLIAKFLLKEQKVSKK
ncbi:MAG: large conductance mechanosensitive channel protein MscL [Candidatus Diapherotrites archaeon]